MNKHLSIALAAALLVAGGSLASAAGTSKALQGSAMSNPSASSTVTGKASDMLNLTTTQQKSAWNDLNGQATHQTAPSGFQPIVGAVVPSTVKIQPVPNKAASDIPSLKPYDFAMVQGKLLIVNPSDKKVAEVING
jgi:hypothetical protein